VSSNSEVVANSESGIQKWARSFGSLGWGLLGGLNKYERVGLQCGGLWEVGGWDVEVVEKVDGNWEAGSKSSLLRERNRTHVECLPHLTT
jgi:hypothetical protein